MHQQRQRLEGEVHSEFPLVWWGGMPRPCHPGQKPKGNTPGIGAPLELGERKEYLGAGCSPGTGK